MNSNHTNIAFSRDINALKECLKPKFFNICGYDPGTLVDRLIQVIVEAALGPYAISASANQKYSPAEIIKSPDLVRCGGFEIEFQAGRLRMPLTQWVLNQAIFLKHWLYVTCAICFIEFRRNIKKPVVIALDVGEESILRNDSDQDFSDFCLKGPIEPLRSAEHILVQFPNKLTSLTPWRIEYAKNPLIYLTRVAKLGIWLRFQLLIKHAAYFLEYAYASIKIPELSLLGRDFAYCSAISTLDEAGLIEGVLLTTSSYVEQQLWVRKIARSRVHMVWYSQSAQLITYKVDRISSAIPNYQWIYAGVHWVWTKKFGEYICKICTHSIFKIVGPIIWCLPKSSVIKADCLRIAVFDVPPFSHKYSISRLGVFPNYYCPENLLAFINAVVNLKASLESELNISVEIILKNKRKERGWANKIYSKRVSNLALHGVFSIASSDINLFELISSCNLVIAYPFSSPPYISEHMGIPAVYFDPTDSIIRDDFSDSKNLLHFISTEDKLLSESIKILTNNN